MAHTPQSLAHSTNGAAIFNNVKAWEAIIDLAIRAATTYGEVTVPLGVRKMIDGVFPLLQRKYIAVGWVDIRRKCDGTMVLVAPVMEEEDYIVPTRASDSARDSARDSAMERDAAARGKYLHAARPDGSVLCNTQNPEFVVQNWSNADCLNCQRTREYLAS